MNIERCFICDDPTGRAGKGEDSIYLGDHGPLCEGCYDEIRDAILSESSVTHLEADNARAAAPGDAPQGRTDTERLEFFMRERYVVHHAGTAYWLEWSIAGVSKRIGTDYFTSYRAAIDAAINAQEGGEQGE